MGTTTKDTEDSRSTRERIIDAAMELFADSGYEGCTVQDIAKAVGIKAASLYAHFGGKEAIFDATLDVAVGRWQAIVDSAFAAASGARGLEEGATTIISRFLDVMAGSTAYRFWTRVYVFPPAHILGPRFSGLLKLDEAFAARVKGACAAFAGAGVPKSDIAVFATSLTHFMMGILVNSMGQAPSLRDVRAGVSLLARGLEAGRKKGKGAKA